jgi:hypothetical protein
MELYFHALILLHGHAIAEAARVRAQVRSCGICGGQCDTGADFLRVLRFLLPILILLTAPHSSSIIRGCYTTYQVYSVSLRPKKLKKTILLQGSVIN